VARCAELDRTRAALAAAGAVIGPAVNAQRAAPGGVLRWRISVPDDGRLRFGGALPTLIEWHGSHPTDDMAPSGLALRCLTLAGLPDALAAALDLGAVQWGSGGAALRADFDTPRGRVELRSD
jgi:hypothetical protein